MKFINNFYIFLVFSSERIWRANCLANLKAAELEHLSEKLHSTECMRLLEAMHSGKSEYKVESINSGESERQRNQNCRVKLEEWNRSFPENDDARGNMEKILRRILGRPDLANYINHGKKRFVEMFNKFAMANGEQQKRKYILRRHAKNSSSHPKKNKKVIADHDVKKHEFLNDKSQEFPMKEVTFQKFNSVSPGKTENSLIADKNSVSDPDDTGWTRCIAIMIFVLLIVSTMITTALIAIYKNRGKLLCGSGKAGKKVCDDRCPLTDSFRRSSDIEYGWSPSSTDYTTSRWQRGSSIPSSESPARSLFGFRDKKSPMKQTKKIKKVKDKKQQTPRLEKKRRSKDNKAKVKKIRKVSMDKKRNKAAEISIREKIANILRKEKADCKCCPCTNSDDNGKHQICSDDHCKQRRILNLTELCSPRSKESRKSTKTSKKKIKKEEYDEGNEQTSSPASSPKSRKDSLRLKEKFKFKEKSPRWSFNEPCTRETCEMRRSARDRNSEDISLEY